MNRTKAILSAYWSGIKEGWDSPYNTPFQQTSVKHLNSYVRDADEIRYTGVNLGQFLRGGNKSQSARYNLRKFPTKNSVGKPLFADPRWDKYFSELFHCTCGCCLNEENEEENV